MGFGLKFNPRKKGAFCGRKSGDIALFGVNTNFLICLSAKNWLTAKNCGANWAQTQKLIK